MFATYSASTPPDDRVATAADNLNTVFNLLRKACGIDFTHYKPNMVARRIERRLMFNQSLDLAGYIRQPVCVLQHCFNRAPRRPFRRPSPYTRCSGFVI